MDIYKAANMFYKLANNLDLFSIEINPENIEEVLEGIISSIQDIDNIEESSGIKLRELVQNMKSLSHSEDEHHYGETILEHTKKVLINIEELATGLDDKTKQLMRLVALCHDLGKAFTHEIKQKDNIEKHTFYGHAEKSVDIIKHLINQQTLEREEYKKLLALVNEHDDILSKYQSRGNSVKYIKNIINSESFKFGLFDLQLAFVQADSVTQQALTETSKMISTIKSDMEKYSKDEIAKDQAAKARAIEIQRLIEEKEPEIMQLFVDKPDLQAMWPDVKAIRAEIGRLKDFDLMKRFNSIIPAK